MPSSFTGDTMKLKSMVSGLSKLARPGWANRINKQLADEGVSLVQECFETSRDPHGRPWPKLQTRAGQPLLDTGRLRNSITRKEVNGGGFIIGTNVEYAAIHNYGGVIKAKNAPVLRFRVGKQWVSKKSVTIPRRQFLPDSGRLSSTWEEAFVELAREFIERELREGRG